MKHRKISKKKALKNKIFKITSVFVVAGLLMGGFFINAPKLFAATDGSGTMSVTPATVQPASANNNFTFHFTNNATNFGPSSKLTLAIPSGWVNPQKLNSVSAGYVTIANSTCGKSPANGPSDISTDSNVVTVKVDQCDAGDTFDLQYKNLTAPVVGSYTFTTQTQEGRDGLANIAASPVVVVAIPDTTAPVITLTGSSPVTVAVGSSYTDLGATASDNIDGNITSSIVTVNPVNTAVVGAYTVTYNVSDAAGNAATPVNRIVNVVDTISPVITLTGANPQVLEVGTAYSELGATVTDNYNTGLAVTINASAVNTAVVGSYIVTYNAVDSSGNAATEVTRTVNVVDTTAPVISLGGSSPVTVLVHTSYTDNGAIASDNYDGNLTSAITTVNNVDTDTVGSYTVTYNVSDAAGNAATEVTRTVNVVDTTSPIINLIDTNPQVIEVDTAYSELGATVTDDYDTGLAATINASAVNTAVVGSYTVTYNAVDSSGNAADQITRTVNVVDTTAPAITLSGSNPQVIEMGTAYSELGATVTDNYDTGLAATINASAVNTAVVGSYTVTYNAVDSSGNNAAPVTRTVNVVDTTAPVITVLPYTTAQTTVDITVSVSTNEGVLNTGSHLFTENGSFDFVATDASGNVTTKTVTITNIDRIAPVITLLSINPFNLTTGDSYVDPGSTAQDNADGDITSNIVTVNPVDTTHEGTYTVTYNVSDAAGNAASEVTRTIIVTKPVVSGPSGAMPDLIPPVLTPPVSTIVNAATEPAVGRVLGEKITILDTLIAALTPFKHDPRVKTLQQELKKLGLFSFPYFTDYYGPITNAGVKKYLSTK